MQKIEAIPINLPSVSGWKEVPIKQTERFVEPLVPVGAFGGRYSNIAAVSIYGGQTEFSPYKPIKDSLISMHLRESTAKKLEKAETFLPKGCHLVVVDAYRPLELQASLFEQYYQPLRQCHPDWSEEQLKTETQKYVSLPSNNPNRPSPHNTGGAVDVLIMKFNDKAETRYKEINARLQNKKISWQEAYRLEMERIRIINESTLLEFGVPFDHGTDKASLNYFEIQALKRPLAIEEEQALINRRLLYKVMTKAGFAAYPDEFWHFNDPLTQMGSKSNGKRWAEYGGAFWSEENQAHEEMRKKHWEGSLILEKGNQEKLTKLADLPEYLRVANNTVAKLPSLRQTNLAPTAEKISPVVQV